MEWDSGEEAKGGPWKSSSLFWPLPVSESILGSCLDLCWGLLSLSYCGNNRAISFPGAPPVAALSSPVG